MALFVLADRFSKWCCPRQCIGRFITFSLPTTRMAVRQAAGGGWGRLLSVRVRVRVGGGCRSGWGRLLPVTDAIEARICRQGDAAGHRLGALEGGGGGTFERCFKGPLNRAWGDVVPSKAK